MRIPKGKVTAMVVVEFVLAILFYPRPLTKQLGLEQFYVNDDSFEKMAVIVEKYGVRLEN